MHLRTSSLPVQLTYHDGTVETVRIVFEACTIAVLAVEDGAGVREIQRDRIRSSGVVFGFSSRLDHRLLVA